MSPRRAAALLAAAVALAPAACAEPDGSRGEEEAAATAPADPASDYAATPPPDGALARPGARLAWWRVEAGGVEAGGVEALLPTVLPVPGGPGMEHRYLRPWLDRLAAAGAASVVYHDPRGLGASPVDSVHEGTVTWERVADDLRALVEAQGDRPVVLLGHSWGAFMALGYALEHPDGLAGLVLVSPVQPGGPYRTSSAARLRARTTAADSAATARARAAPGLARREPEAIGAMYRAAFGPTVADRSVLERLDLTPTPRTARHGDEVGRLVANGLSAVDVWGRLGEIEVPVLVLHGEEDPTDPALVRELAAALPDAEARFLADAGHFPFAEAPGAFDEAVTAFLARLGRR